MESILRFMGITPLKETEKKLAEIEALNIDIEKKVKNIESEIASANGEAEWFLCRRKPGGKRKGDNSI